ncbi:phage holin family protein [Lederbergia wuyishanensis]|uniref:Membrane protein n=1 Tax=Lederbergia wuyishanensis TaxID=1347903 RepID=A0ABU0D8K2_9BACI|nr:phage holin family protein [Lederbergia wuyishanensis]MCJ8007682.1 phage holin family protein [Lederbergia wuyishanensis]MDQ0344734.1 putative membrane protein [Lederbergia wuyishanensis]
MKWIIGILINALLFIAFAGYFEGFQVSSFGAAVGASIVLYFINMLVRPLLVILTLPVTILSLGLFLFVINACTLLITDAIMGSKFDISGFGLALLIAIIMSIVNLIIHKTVIEPKKRK